MGGEVNLAVIDCDDTKQPGTSGNIQQCLSGLGYLPGDYPVVQTASGVGRHYYFSFSGGLDGNFCNISSEYGMGEIRYGNGACVAAPPSEITDQGEYTFIDGDLRQLPHITTTDILQISTKNEVTFGYSPYLVSPILAINDLIQQRKKPKISRFAWNIKGNPLDECNNRSDVEWRLVLSLVNTGHNR